LHDKIEHRCTKEWNLPSKRQREREEEREQEIACFCIKYPSKPIQIYVFFRIVFV
jgi:hypothetical protein